MNFATLLGTPLAPLLVGLRAFANTSDAITSSAGSLTPFTRVGGILFPPIRPPFVNLCTFFTAYDTPQPP